MIKNFEQIAKDLIQEQCPQFQHLNVKPVAKSGHDNRTFHLGQDMTVRLPSGPDYALQPLKEGRWLPYLAAQLNIPIPQPLYLGQPSYAYPYHWLVLSYLRGDTVSHETIPLHTLAVELRDFLKNLQEVNCDGGPIYGQHNFYRGGPLDVYHQQTCQALESVQDIDKRKKLEALWTLALSEPYQGQIVWVHGDIAPGNLLVDQQHLSAVIDFGTLGCGDPACDYAMAWSFFDASSRQIFLQDLAPDMRNRAMGWALWKALITYHDEKHQVQAEYTLNEILNDQFI